MHYYLYMTTNKVNGKFYIGAHETKIQDDSYLGSGKYLQNAIKKYGRENFERIIFDVFANREEMYEAEHIIVSPSFVKRKDTYNLKVGGRGGFEHIRNNPKYESWFRSGLDKGQKNGLKIIQHLQKNDKEYIKRRSIKYRKTIKKQQELGIYKQPMSFKDKKHTEETRKKMSESHKRYFQNGGKNSQLGTIWIYNLKLKENKKINKTDSIPDGWVKGRKIKF